MEKSLGICIGASTIKIVELIWENGEFSIGKTSLRNHECNPKKIFLEELKNFNLSSYDYVCVTGRRFKDALNLAKITEAEATEYALKHYLRENRQRFNALISLGSENFILYGLDEAANIIKVQTGNKCASGTGEFFLQQIRRMDVSLDEAIRLAKVSEPHYVSGRCSVFCKSDCTHAMNRGVPIGRVCAGLGNMIADKILELLRSYEKEDILLVGGVTKNSYVLQSLRERIKNLVIPEHADIFEAFGAAIFAYEKKKKPQVASLFGTGTLAGFTSLPALDESQRLVSFKKHQMSIASEGDEYILGLDVGSTTTKAILLRTSDDRIVASVYLRTNGNPVKASRACYAELHRQLGAIEIDIIGLGVAGSGRKIAALHALTDGIINEIIAHATAAAFFDKEVDTIIEIGGQDAKYTYLVNGVPCDYAMNEACSAGTGSFLEEAAKESLNINYLDIQDIALKAKNPTNFNDQCAAFISSDIKNASHENISREDIVAGLLYSICMNYNNRVKGLRKVGKKIFMQGGVCYNSAIPLAMANLLKKEITVPPEPGLMGAFGVALEIKKRIAMGLMKKSRFSLKELADREVEYGKNFTCSGTSENCDRGCAINIIRMNGRNYPFGGICNKYYNIMHHLSIDPKPFDIVAKRQKLVFDCHSVNAEDVLSSGRSSNGANGTNPIREVPLTSLKFSNGVKRIGILKSFLTNSLFPLYYHFFSELGLDVELADTVDKEGMNKTCSSFCFPAEISHGLFMALIKKRPDYIFLPQITELYVEGSHSYEPEHQCSCVLLQSEPYYLRSAFRDIDIPIIATVLNFSRGWESAQVSFVEIGKELGIDKIKSRGAFKYAIEKQNEFFRKRKELGDELLKEIEKDKSKIGVVLFGRAYNAFAAEANLGIPRKFASRGFYIIPFDCLRYEHEDSIENMNWALGQEIIKAARFVKKHPQLFAAYITNFSCGPDSFIVGYLRDIMKTKPSLTLELDSHSADAGINTRIEAFLDIVTRYRRLGIQDRQIPPFRKADFIQENGKSLYISSDNELYSLKNPRIKIIIPSMGRTATEIAAATFRGFGFNAESVPLPDFKTLMLGRSHTSCKECLPLILTTASLLHYIKDRKRENELLLYFMPTVSGNCRFSQYYVFMKRLIEKKRIKNVALLTLTSENSYAWLGPLKSITLLKAIIIADIMDDIKNALLVLAEDKRQALLVFDEEWKRILLCFENGCKGFYEILNEVSTNLAKINLKYRIEKAKKVLLAGEIYVRKDEFSSGNIIERLAKRDIVVKRAPILEWLYYVDYILKNQIKPEFRPAERLELFLRQVITPRLEKKIKHIFSSSGLYEYEAINIDEIMNIGSAFIPRALTGEAILVVGAFFKEILKTFQGVISVGPFSCLPTRLTESILSQESRVAANTRLNFLENIDDLQRFDTLPFLSVECDGNPFPQIIESRIEAFCLQVERLFGVLNHG